MKEPWRDYVEYFNETLLFIQTVWMCTLTDFVPSAWTRYYVSGWVMIYMMYVQFSFNAMLLVYQLLTSIRINYYKLRF